MRVLTTVWHTGTQYVMQHHERDAVLAHCGEPFEELFDNLEGTADFVTTYRDPLRVGASWANRYRRLQVSQEDFEKEYEIHWLRQWGCYARVLMFRPKIYRVADFTEKPVKSKADRLALHRALDRGDLERYHEYIPKHWIDFANECSEAVNA